MKTTTKNIYRKIITILLFAIGINQLQAQTFRESDLNGTWVRGDGIVFNIFCTGRFEEGSSAIGNGCWQ